MPRPDDATGTHLGAVGTGAAEAGGESRFRVGLAARGPPTYRSPAWPARQQPQTAQAREQSPARPHECIESPPPSWFS